MDFEAATELIARIQTEETWLICGGRNFTDREVFRGAMADLCVLRGLPKKIIHGASKGADSLAAEWGKVLGLEVVAVPANWAAYGPSAGPRRNEEMLSLHSPDFVVAFPGGRGTADMISRAKYAGVKVAEVELIEEEPPR